MNVTGLFLRLAICVAMVGEAFSLEAEFGESKTKVQFGVNGMYLASSSEQGGRAESSLSTFHEADILAQHGWIGYGFLIQYDTHGKRRADLEVGYKFQVGVKTMYAEFAHTPLVYRSFVSQSTVLQEGHGFRYGIGFRAPLILFPGMFAQLSYKQRVQILSKQNGKGLSENHIRRDTYPLIGLSWIY